MMTEATTQDMSPPPAPSHIITDGASFPAAASDTMDSGVSPDLSDDSCGVLSAKSWQDQPSRTGSDRSNPEQRNVKIEDSVEPGHGFNAEHHTMPVQKRWRITRACDECRRKKIKCDGRQPCTYCSVYSYGIASPHDATVFPWC